MAAGHAAWFARHGRLITRSILVLLVAVVAVESFLLFVQGSAGREADTQSDRLLATLLGKDTTQVAAAAGVPIRLENVRFKWSDRVDLDDLNSFVLQMQRSDVLVEIGVLEGILNESVFNYPESKLRDMRLKFREDDGTRVLHLSGKLKTVL